MNCYFGSLAYFLGIDLTLLVSIPHRRTFLVAPDGTTTIRYDRMDADHA